MADKLDSFEVFFRFEPFKKIFQLSEELQVKELGQLLVVHLLHVEVENQENLDVLLMMKLFFLDLSQIVNDFLGNHIKLFDTNRFGIIQGIHEIKFLWRNICLNF